MNKQNEEFYEYFYNRDSDSSVNSGVARWEFYLLKSIIKYADKNAIKNILEVGCGQGNKTAILGKYFNEAKIKAIDPSYPGIRNAKSNYSEITNIEFMKYDIEQYKNNSDIKFDIVAGLEILEHVDDWQDLLNKMLEFSNKYILLSFPTGVMRDYEVHVGHLRNFKRGEVEEFLANKGFKVVKTFYSGFPLYTPLARDYIDKHYDSFMNSIDTKFTKSQELFHHIVYLSFRFFCFKNIGDKFTGLFEKTNITVNSNGGGVNYSILFIINLDYNNILKAFIYLKICECFFILNIIFQNNQKVKLFNNKNGRII